MSRSWRRVASSLLQDCRVFAVEKTVFEPSDGGAPDTFFRIEAPDWINVIPLTSDREVLLIRQYRFGIEEHTLEIPGGVCDPGETPLQTARRELREETGHEAREWVELGWVHPNPALQGNRCHTFLATDLVRVGDPQPDPHESFEQSRAPVGEIPQLIREGRITHALAVAAFQLLDAREAASAD